MVRFPLYLVEPRQTIFYAHVSMEATYKAIIAVFETHWTVHALCIVDTFFGLHFVSSDDCVTIDQTTKVETIIAEVYGPAWKSQHPSSSLSIPMKTGTAYSELLARANGWLSSPSS
jgi:hypothetical protein